MTGRHRYDLQDVLARVDLERLFDHFAIDSVGSGHRRRFRCPDPSHPDRNPSVTIGDKAGGPGDSYRCWSGNHRGDAIDLVKTQLPGTTTPEAIEWLADWAGIPPDQPLPRASRRAHPSRAAGDSTGGSVPFDQVGQRYVRRCAAILHGPLGELQRQWLADRGIPLEVADANLVGADPGMVHLHRARGLPAATVPGVTFPALGPTGAITYVQLRSLPEDTVPAADIHPWHAERGWRKYDNPARHRGTNPRISFQITLPERQRRPDALLVTEGIPDALTAAAAGFSAAAVLGNQAPDALAVAVLANVATSRRATPVLVIDADDAGTITRDRLRYELNRFGMRPAEVSLPAGADLNRWAIDNPDSWADELDDRITQATSDVRRLDRSAGRDATVNL